MPILHNNSYRGIEQKILLSCGIFGSLLFILLYLIDGFIRPGYSPVLETISSLELLEYGWIQQGNFILFGFLLICFSVGVRKELQGGFGENIFPFFQILTALGLFVSGVFIHEPFHTIGDLISFISVIISFFVIANRFRKEPDWKGWAAYSIISAIVMMFFLTLFGIALGHGGPAGLFERLASGVRSLWTIIFVSTLLLTRKTLRRL